MVIDMNKYLKTGIFGIFLFILSGLLIPFAFLNPLIGIIREILFVAGLLLSVLGILIGVCVRIPGD